MADKRKSAAVINSGSDSDSDVSDSEFQVSLESHANDAQNYMSLFPALGQETEECSFKVTKPVTSISKKVPING